MENLQRKLEKDVTRLASVKPAKRKRRWTFLLVANDGKTIAVRMFKALVALFLIVMFSAVAAALSFYYLYQSEKRVNRHLERTIKAHQQHLISLRHRKDVLMAKLLITESKIKEHTSTTQMPSLQPSPEPAEKMETIVETPVNEPLREAGTEQFIEMAVESQSETQAVVGVEKFIVSFDSYTDTTEVNFIIRKTDPDLANVSGRTLVVLKRDLDQVSQWVSLPSVPLISGRPSRNDRGRFFSIARFKPISLEASGLNTPGSFKYATVYVFSADGKKLLEKDLPIEVNGMN
jgi:hypothetical protein